MSAKATDTKENANWAVDFATTDRKWAELDGGEKATYLVKTFLKLVLVVTALYAFICSLSFLAAGFRLVAGRQAGEIFRNSEVFNNPIAGMLVGILVTVLVQSSSTSTSIVITMVAADLFTVRQAISLIMGANIGTSVTSTIVALGQSHDRAEFRRAFAAATVHDMFNFLNVLVLLPIEAITGYLYHFSAALIPSSLQSGQKPPDLLKALTKPFTKMIMSVDKKVITKIAAAETPEALAKLDDARILKHFFGMGPDAISDGGCGVIVLIFALIVLCLALFTIVYTLKSVLKGQIAAILHKSVNGDIPGAPWLTGYVAIGAGFGLTILVQSSSITTSALTPLVGMGVITVDRMYPTVLGANIGTTVTGVLAALAADGSKLALTLQVAFAHLLFNITGILIWYVFWPLRPVPINAAKFLGNVTADYKWFAVFYLFLCFFLIPLIIMGLSIASMPLAVTVIVIAILIGLFVLIVNVLQARKPDILPEKLKNWEFLPLWMRSLEPMDRILCAPMSKLCCKVNAKESQTSPA